LSIPIISFFKRFREDPDTLLSSEGKEVSYIAKTVLAKAPDKEEKVARVRSMIGKDQRYSLKLIDI
jgi:hypothetical protein